MKKTSLITRALSMAMAIIFICGAFTGGGLKKEEPTTEPSTTEPTTLPPVYYNPLTGQRGYDETLIGSRPVLISVENHPKARPQWGLTSSDIVWEMVAEGGITRMLLMYADYTRIPEKVGPTRSARHYFVDLAEGFDAIFVHFGYSPAAKKQLKAHGVNNINGMVDGAYFFRDKSRRKYGIEHTAYTTDEAIAKAIEKKGYRTEIKDEYASPFMFTEEPRTLSGGACDEITVSFSSSYTYKYTYDATRNVYLSTIKGKKFVDSEGTQQNFENIIVCYTNISNISGDQKGRVNFDLSKGKGVYVTNGTYEEITWEKGDSKDMMKFYDVNGMELVLNAGRTYIAIVDNDRESKNTILPTEPPSTEAVQ